MTSRPRGKRTTSDSSSDSASGAAKGGKKKTSTRRRSAGGAAEKRPPRVSLPPAMGAGGAKKKAPAPASSARRPAAPSAAPRAARPAAPSAASNIKPKPAPRTRAAAPAAKPASAARPASKPAPRTPAATRPAPTPPPAAARPAPSARPAPAAPSQPPRPPAAPRAQGPSAPNVPAQRPPVQPPQQRAPQPPQRPAPQQNLNQQPPRPAQPSHDQRPQGQRPPAPQSQPPRQGHPNAPRPPAPGAQQQNHQRPPQQQPQQRDPQHGGQHGNHQQQRPPAPPQAHGRPEQRHQPGRAPGQQSGGGHRPNAHPNAHPNSRPAQPAHQPQQRAPQHQPHAPRPEHAAPRPHAPVHPAPTAPPAPAAAPVASKQSLGNAAPEGFNQKAFEEIFEKDIPFSQLGLNEWLLKGITEAGFVYPTSIQAKLIPTILTGKDVLGQAKTGTGKTAAFALPMLNALGKGDAFGGLVLVPTRELALQVAADFKELGKYTGLSILPVYGGQNINTQAQALARGGGPEIIVATPGRVMDMAQRGYLHHHNVKMVVLDEVDRMLDIGFRDDIRRILSACPKERQTVFVSATMQPEVEQLARTFARDCEKIIASAGALTVAMVKQFYLSVEPWDKKQLLLHLLTHESPALTVVFCRTKRTVDNLTEYLGRKGIDAHAIHGDMQQGKRNRVIEELRSGKLAVLIASDLASRGLDVEGITHVINYDLPEDPDLYVHRIGRTARAGRDGVAWALVTPEQGELLTQIEHLINAEIPKLDYPDFKPGPLPADILAEREGAARRAEQSKSFNRFAQSFIAPAAGAPPAAAPAASSAASGPAARPAPAALPGPSPTDASKFPGGIVPSKMPPRLMYGKVRTARSMKQAIAQAQSAPPKPPEQGGSNADT